MLVVAGLVADLRRCVVSENELRAELDRQARRIAALERKYKKLELAAREVVLWADWNGAGYTCGRLPIDNLRKAVRALNTSGK